MNQNSIRHPFRRAVLRGLGVVLPPLLTIVFFLWLWNSVQNYILQPLGSASGSAIYWVISDVYDEPPAGADRVPGSNVYLLKDDGGGDSGKETGGKANGGKGNGGTGNGGTGTGEKTRRYVALPSGQLIPSEVYNKVMMDPGDHVPTTAEAAYKRHIETDYLPARWVIPAFFGVFILILYLLGKFIAASIGRMILTNVEQLIGRVPIISTVYGSVKQVTDLIFSDQEIEYTRVVAIEYPRVGLWSLGFVTGESMLSIQNVASEPVLSVLMPTSPMPATGFTVTIRRSEALDLGITVDQAFQFIVSCGVVVPVGEQTENVQEELQALVQQQIADSK